MYCMYIIIVCRWLVTHLGGFFIKRKLDTAAGKDVLYRKCLHEVRLRGLATAIHNFSELDPLHSAMLLLIIDHPGPVPPIN